MHGLTPELIRLGTRKIGIISLTESWIRGPLRSWLFDLTASRAFVESSVWNGSEARAAVERAVDGVASIGPVWPIPRSSNPSRLRREMGRHVALLASIEVTKLENQGDRNVC